MMMLKRSSQQLERALSYGGISRGELIIIIRDYQQGGHIPEIVSRKLEIFSDMLDYKINIVIGYINEGNEFEIID